MCDVMVIVIVSLFLSLTSAESLTTTHQRLLGMSTFPKAINCINSYVYVGQ